MTTLNFRPVDGGTLDRSARAADRAVERIQDAQQALAIGDSFALTDALGAANEDAQAAYLLLTTLGARAGGGSPRSAEVTLSQLDTPATRRLLDALQFAVTCARDVDAERGWTLADGTPCGLTESVGDVCEIVRAQVEGPTGRE